MRRYPILALILLTMAAMFLASMSAAAVPSPFPAASPSWNEHADLMTILIGVLITLVCFFMVRTLAKIDRNQGRLFEKLDVVCKQVDTLQGEHNVMKNFCSGGIPGDRAISRRERPD
ncbi:MAG: hypothetical protein M0P74_00845 [Syntrophales bacterium]|jgi:hypothetical protein|nr:hypothetical protein [Syntrophales bacterium]